jgi:hypothetical protein
VALEEPGYALHCQRILAVPNKRHVTKADRVSQPGRDRCIPWVSESFQLDRAP